VYNCNPFPPISAYIYYIFLIPNPSERIKHFVSHFSLFIMPLSNAIELQAVRRIDPISNDTMAAVDLPRDIPAEVDVPSLPLSDHGKQAYLVLLRCTMIQAPIWGNICYVHVSPSIFINIIGYSLSLSACPKNTTPLPLRRRFAQLTLVQLQL
jgi:hypothetical protein